LNQCCSLAPQKTFFDSIARKVLEIIYTLKEAQIVIESWRRPLQRRASGAGLAKPFSAAVLGLVAG